MPQEPVEGPAKAHQPSCVAVINDVPDKGLHGLCYAQDRLQRHRQCIEHRRKARRSSGTESLPFSLLQEDREGCFLHSLRSRCSELGRSVLARADISPIVGTCHGAMLLAAAGWCMTDRKQWRQVAQLCIVSYDLYQES